MPVQLGKPRVRGESGPRIEVIPLIDIMFFLLAAFMLVSLSMVNLNTVDVALPTATTATEDTGKDLLNVAVDANGVAYLEGNVVSSVELVNQLETLKESGSGVRVLLSADRDTRYEDVVRALDATRRAGVDDVAFELELTEGD